MEELLSSGSVPLAFVSVWKTSEGHIVKYLPVAIYSLFVLVPIEVSGGPYADNGC